LQENIHGDRDLVETFLHWLNSKAIGLSKQSSFNKNQVQELLLGIGLTLRDLEFANFLEDYNVIPVPAYLVDSKLLATDLPEVGKAMDAIHKAVQFHLK
jgi:hypothetical protein